MHGIKGLADPGTLLHSWPELSVHLFIQEPIMGHSAVLLAVALAILLACGTGAPVQRQRKLLLVSFDGFRWNYDQDVDTPNLDAMAQEGVKARYMTPAFVTMTSPCHFTIVTGECQPQDGAMEGA